MTIKHLNSTDYANIYGLYENEKLIGTKEVKIAGHEAGKKFYYSLTGDKTKTEIRKLFANCRN